MVGGKKRKIGTWHRPKIDEMCPNGSKRKRKKEEEESDKMGEGKKKQKKE